VTAACGEDPPTPPVEAGVPDVAPDVAPEPDVPATPDTVDAGPDVPEPTGLGCSAPPEVPLAATGPLPAPVQPKRGIDHWERSDYETLRDAALSDPGVHFVATWDVERERFVVESGPVDARQTVEFTRVAKPDGGLEYTVLAGELSAIFPETTAALYGDWTSLMAAYANGVLPADKQSYPLPMERIAVLFDAPAAPDVVGSVYPWAYPAPGTHGGLSLLQSRSTLILSGAGVRQGVVLDGTPVLPSMVPTVMAALGAPTTGGVGPDGTYDDGLYMLRQDGPVLWEALDPDPCRRAKRALILDFDGLMASEINHQALDDDPEVDLPTFRALAQGGVVYQHGAVANFPSVSAPGHMTNGTGLWSGHHGFVANAFYDRDGGAVVNPFSLITDLADILEDPQQAYDLYETAVADGTETLAQAVHRAFGDDHFVVVINEIAVGGADYTTIDYLMGAVFDPFADIPKYQLADKLAVTQVTQVLADPDVPVPTVVQVSLFATDAAGEETGPHTEVTRGVLVEIDAQVAQILAAYEERGALEDTVVVLVSDHGMEKQDPDQASGFAQKIAASGVKLIQPMGGMLYLKNMRIAAVLEASTLTVTVWDHLTDAPVSGATVLCEGCDEDGLHTDDSGIVELQVTPDAPAVGLTVLHDGFNPQTLAVQ